jgi:hypothetical protein
MVLRVRRSRLVLPPDRSAARHAATGIGATSAGRVHSGAMTVTLPLGTEVGLGFAPGGDRVRRTSLLTAAALALALSSPATAQGLELRIDKKATIVDGGQGVLVTITTTCPAGGELLEAFVYVNQDGFSSEWGFLNSPCDGTPHESTVEVTALDFLFHKGKASASGYMLLTSGESISPVQPLKLRIG